MSKTKPMSPYYDCPTVVVREKNYDAKLRMRRFIARDLGNGRFYNIVTQEIFDLGNNLEVEEA